MGGSNYRGATILVFTLLTFLLDCAPLTHPPAPATNDHSENKVFFREPLASGDFKEDIVGTSSFVPKTFSIFPAVPLQAFSLHEAYMKEHWDGDEADYVDQSHVVANVNHSPVVVANVDHSSVVANVIESLNQTINKIELNQLSTQGVKKIFSEIISAVAKLVPELDQIPKFVPKDLSSGGPAMEVENDNVQLGLELEKHGHEEVEKKVVDEVEIDLSEHNEHENEVEPDLADGLSIFAGWPNICKLLWYSSS